MTQYSFERPFRLKILALMLDSGWISKFGANVIQPEYFDQEDEEAVATGIHEYRAIYKRSPTDSADLVAMVGVEYTDIIEEVYDIYEGGDDKQLASDKVLAFARGQAAKIAILESVDDVNKGDFERPIQRMKDALKVGEMILSPGIDVANDTDKWLFDYWTDKVRTGLRILDQMLDGGLGVPELGIILAPPNRGKSMALINIGYGAASIGSGVNVVHFTHEMKISQVAKRYAARMTFRFPKRTENLEDYEDELIEAARKLLPGKIRIIGGAKKMSLMDIRNRLDMLLDEGFNPGLMIDDYPDLIISPKNYGERRFELSAIYEGLREISEDYNIPVWGASQSGRASFSKEIITMQDIAEDIGKAAIADVIVALCQTYEEEQADLARLFIAKLRDGSKKKDMIRCSFYGGSQALITKEIVKRKSDEKDV